jgi:hypothetical protein
LHILDSWKVMQTFIVMLQGRRMYRGEDLCHCKSVVFVLFAIFFITLLCIILC